MQAQLGMHVERGRRPVTGFSVSQVAMHGLLGVLTASLVTYAAARANDRPTGYVAGVVAIAVTAIPGLFMFRRWRWRRRPGHRGVTVAEDRARVEGRLPSRLVYLHGAAVVTTVVLLVLLFFTE